MNHFLKSKCPTVVDVVNVAKEIKSPPDVLVVFLTASEV